MNYVAIAVFLRLDLVKCSGKHQVRTVFLGLESQNQFFHYRIFLVDERCERL